MHDFHLPDFLRTLQQALGPRAVITTAEDTAPFLQDSRELFQSSALAVVRPANTAEVASTVKLCRQHRVGIVPQGGNTGRVGGASIDTSAGAHLNGQILLNLGRMNQVLKVDALNFTMDVQAGCILATAQQAAASENRLFPLRLGAEGSCQIGGNLASNAGGINALRYGSARDLVLGLEVVTASGEIWDGMNHLRKNNAGYPLRELFLGTEGTLGIITAAVLKVFPATRGRATAMAGLDSLSDALAVLEKVRLHSSTELTACEVICRRGIEFAYTHIERCRDPFEEAHPWYLLLELDGQQSDEPLRESLTETLADCQEAEIVKNAVLADNGKQRDDLWALREGVVAAQRFEGGSIKHDISLPISAVPDFVDEVLPIIEARMPGIRPCPFGHLGDGNLHFNLSQPSDMPTDEFLSHWPAFNTLVHNVVARYGGSFAAEHGVGRLKRDELEARSSATSIAMMHDLKQALDPQGILNPGKVLGPRMTESY